MRYLLVILCLMTFETRAGCMIPFTISAIGVSESDALEKIQSEANGRCGNDEFGWANILKKLESEKVEVDGEILIKAKAQYLCCFGW